jgi:hypothetical protein
MPETIAEFLSDDHDRLDALLSRAGANDAVDREAYEAFRRGLLKHVGMEEMILLPSVLRLTGRPASLAAKIRLDHGALTALLVPTPTPAIVRAIKMILTAHNQLEERAGGLYKGCEASLGPRAAGVLAALEKAREIPPAAHSDGPRVMSVVRRALKDAGYERVALF